MASSRESRICLQGDIKDDMNHGIYIYIGDRNGDNIAVGRILRLACSNRHGVKRSCK